jgi:hypothetical protein
LRATARPSSRMPASWVAKASSRSTACTPIDPARARSGSRSRIRRPQALCDLRIGLERAAKSSPLDGPHGHARRVRYLGIKRHRATCPAPRDDSTGAGNRAQIAKCVGYDDGDIHRLSTARFARKESPVETGLVTSTHYTTGPS